MKYYNAHESEYQKRLAAGQVAWDKGTYDDIDIRPFIEHMLKESTISPSGSCALDIGCGTGGLACMLASIGFSVTGIDISPTAISVAKHQSSKRGLAITFHVRDLCRDTLARAAFDLIIDNHFLHCIVRPEERQFVLQNLRKGLKKRGEFWMETMVGHPDMIPLAEWNLDETGVTWCVVPEEKRTHGCIERDGKIWYPIRKIQPSDELLVAELLEADLDIVWQQTEPPSAPGETGTFRARCRPRAVKQG